MPRSTIMLGGILVGGASRRMGRPKALLELDGGITLLARTIDVVRAAGLEPVLVGQRPELEAALAATKVQRIDDVAADAGPLAGLVALLELAGDAHAIAVACDMPRLGAAELRRLAEAARGPAVLAPRRDGHWEPLAARYHAPKVIPAAAARLAAGELGLQGLLDEVGARELASHGGGRWLEDWDTPEDMRP